MPKAICADADFIRIFEECGPKQTARRIGTDIRSVYSRRERLEKKIGRQIVSPNKKAPTNRTGVNHPQHIPLLVENGIVLVGSDAHYWPALVSTAHRAFVRACKSFNKDLRAVIMNGDVLDGASISRHPPIGWEDRPTLQQELETCQERLGEIEAAAGKVERIWTAGNHDLRLETRIATVAPEFAKMHGTSLHHHFPFWSPTWAVWINNEVVVKHRHKNGIHAVHNSTMWSGKSMVTGHLHSLKVAPFTDYRGTRYGVDCGTLAAPYGPQFQDYTETNPLNWRSGFVVLTFHRGQLLMPELVMVRDEDAGEVEFRGKVYTV